MFLVTVLVEHPIIKLDDGFTYLSNEEINSGIRVYIPFRNKKIVGYVTNCIPTNQTKQELEKIAGYRYQFIQECIDETPLLNDELQQLALTLSKITLSSKVSVMQAMLPPSLKPSSAKKVKIKTVKHATFIKNISNLTPKQREVLNLIEEKSLAIVDIPCSKAVLDKLVVLGAIEYRDIEVYRQVDEIEKVENHIQLTNDQNRVIDEMKTKLNQYHTHLLHGVTGSGKTEVYLQMVEVCLKEGKQAIILVPEIALTPMLVKAFKQRFWKKVAIIHSKLSAGQRYDEYRKIARQEVDIVVGARSAIFAPLNKIGLIILDEEHDASYKQTSTPRYSTHQVARMRAKNHQCLVILASATPSIESYSRAKENIYGYSCLKHRVFKQAMPQVSLIDMKNELKQGNYSLFSKDLMQALQQCINDGNQAMLLLNKRGFERYIRCVDCGEVVMCPHCSLSLTYHKAINSLKCHYCDFQITPPSHCPKCQSVNLHGVGHGIQKIEEQLENILVGAKVIRYDIDSTRNVGGHQKLLKAFENKEANILLGTQMIAKGLDFEDVTFVGVIDGDTSLHLPDFRSNERTFQLLSQVAGRCGRHQKQGHVMIQTMNPNHIVMQSVVDHDYEKFYASEIEFRKLATYPPFIQLVSLLIESKDEQVAIEVSNEIAHYLKTKLQNAVVLGAVDSMIYKMQNQYRRRILIKYRHFNEIYDYIKAISDHYNKSNQKVIIICDFNPYSQM